MCEVLIQRRHLVFGDGILKALEGSLLYGFWRGWVCEGEDVLGEREEGEFRVLRFGTHGEVRTWRWRVGSEMVEIEDVVQCEVVGVFGDAVIAFGPEARKLTPRGSTSAAYPGTRVEC